MAEQERALIVGLGNPGRQYARHRHNIGFQCVERLAAAHGLVFDQRKGNARLALGRIAARPVILAQPQTFMNESGRSVVALMQFYKVPVHALLVVFDDLDLPLGTVRLRAGGSSGGQRGMRSIIAQLGRDDFVRVRLGIGRPPGQMDPAAYVLQNFGPDELPIVAEVLDHAADACVSWLVDGIESTMSRYNADVMRDA